MDNLNLEKELKNLNGVLEVLEEKAASISDELDAINRETDGEKYESIFIQLQDLNDAVDYIQDAIFALEPYC